MITNPVDGMRVRFVDPSFQRYGIGTLCAIDVGWCIRWAHATSLPFMWTGATEANFELADEASVPPAPAASTEPMTDRERLIARRVRDGKKPWEGFFNLNMQAPKP